MRRNFTLRICVIVISVLFAKQVAISQTCINNLTFNSSFESDLSDWEDLESARTILNATCTGSSIKEGFVDEALQQRNILIKEIKRKSDNSTFYLFSHGRSGELLINGKWKTATQIYEWFNSNNLLDAKTHLNIYGCNFAKGKKGKQAVSYLEMALGVSIAASDDVTGKDGDWILEIGGYNSNIELDNYAFNLQCTGSITTTAINGRIIQAGGSGTQNVDLSVLGASIGDTMEVDNLQARGDIDGGTNEYFTVAINGGTATTHVESTSAATCEPVVESVFGSLNGIVTVIDIGGGIPGIRIFVQLGSGVGVFCDGNSFALEYTVDITYVSCIDDPCDPVTSGNPDLDGDNVSDICDLDDDNDGILDIDEITCGNVTTIIFNETFGSGTNPGSALPTGITNYCYEDLFGSCPAVSAPGHNFIDVDDGQYTIVNDASVGFTTIPVFRSMADHTGDVSGYMLVVNANFDPGEMYRINSIAVTPGTEVMFSAWLANISSQWALNNCISCCGGLILPSVNFIIEDATTLTTLSTVASGGLPLVPDGSDAWGLYSSSLVIPSGVTEINVVLVDNTPGGCGNDLALDDIILVEKNCDTDLDGILNIHDLDSDGDGCADALEGSGSYTSTDLVTDTNIDGGGSNVQDNLGTSSNADGTPSAGPTQGIGDSQEAATQSVDCTGSTDPCDPRGFRQSRYRQRWCIRHL